MEGVTRSLTEWAEYLGIHRLKFYGRVKRGWSVYRTLTEDL